MVENQCPRAQSFKQVSHLVPNGTQCIGRGTKAWGFLTELGESSVGAAPPKSPRPGGHFPSWPPSSRRENPQEVLAHLPAAQWSSLSRCGPHHCCWPHPLPQQSTHCCQFQNLPGLRIHSPHCHCRRGQNRCYPQGWEQGQGERAARNSVNVSQTRQLRPRSHADPQLCVASLQGHSPQVTSLHLHQNQAPNPGLPHRPPLPSVWAPALGRDI